jgi:hypothetical protein
MIQQTRFRMFPALLLQLGYLAHIALSPVLERLPLPRLAWADGPFEGRLGIPAVDGSGGADTAGIADAAGIESNDVVPSQQLLRVLLLHTLNLVNPETTRATGIDEQ